ncbi:MAG: hypothetical protein ACRD0P_26225, partial [Stackebrandtia sp.]
MGQPSVGVACLGAFEDLSGDAVPIELGYCSHPRGSVRTGGEGNRRGGHLAAMVGLCPLTR